MAYLEDFDIEDERAIPITFDSEVQCPHCQEFSKIDSFTDTSFVCENCFAEHPTIRCPKCKSPFASSKNTAPLVTVRAYATYGKRI